MMPSAIALVLVAGLARSGLCSVDAGDTLAAIQVRKDTAPGNARGRGLRYRQQLHNYIDIEYEGDVFLGNQKLRAIYDTGSFEVLAISTLCESYDCKHSRYRYDHMKSSQYKSLNHRQSHSFGSGDVNSLMAVDNMTIGPYSAMQGFWEVDHATMPILDDGTFEIIFGVGDPHEPLIDMQYLKDSENPIDVEFFEDYQRYPPWLENMRLNRFGVCYLREPNSPGFFIWHDHDPSAEEHARHFIKLDVTGVTTWSVNIDGVRLSGHDDMHWCPPGQCQAILDTGTSLLTAPSHVVRALKRKLQVQDGDCRPSKLAEFPTFEFILNGSVVKMPPESYIGLFEGQVTQKMWQYINKTDPADRDLRQTNKSQQGWRKRCQLLMMSVDMTSSRGLDNWILGMPFFREFYAVFDFGSDGHYSTRNVYLAKADAGCNHPSDREAEPDVLRAQAQGGAGEPHVRTIDAARLRPPLWTSRLARSAPGRRGGAAPGDF